MVLVKIKPKMFTVLYLIYAINKEIRIKSETKNK